MMIPLGRRRLIIQVVSARLGSDPAATPPRVLAAESDREFARLASGRSGELQRAQRDVDQILYAGPPMR